MIPMHMGMPPGSRLKRGIGNRLDYGSQGAGRLANNCTRPRLSVYSKNTDRILDRIYMYKKDARFASRCCESAQTRISFAPRLCRRVSSRVSLASFLFFTHVPSSLDFSAAFDDVSRAASGFVSVVSLFSSTGLSSCSP